MSNYKRFLKPNPELAEWLRSGVCTRSHKPMRIADHELPKARSREDVIASIDALLTAHGTKV